MKKNRLIQEIRARQAMDEVGIKGSIEVIHSENPKTLINGKEYTLVFPKFISDIKEKKVIDTSFIGLITEQRRKFLSDFPSAVIFNSDNGRKQDTKEMDLSYFRVLAKSKFILCPDGDFTWTYRFFEAILCRALPIVENYCNLYYGYHFYKKGDKYTYRKDWVNENLNKIRKEMML